MTTGGEALAHVMETVSYLRVAIGAEDEGTDWYRCKPLVSDPDALMSLARSTAAGRGTDQDRIALSLFVQGYSYRMASLAVGAFLLSEVVVEVPPEMTSIKIGRHRPNAVRFDEAAIAADHRDFKALHFELVDRHLAPLLANSQAGLRIGSRLLWSNVGAACASAFGAFMNPLPERRGEIRELAQDFFASARPELRGSGALVPVGTEWAWERASCCLWHRTEEGSPCSDCVLWSQEDRQQRYDAAIAAQSEGATSVKETA